MNQRFTLHDPIQTEVKTIELQLSRFLKKVYCAKCILNHILVSYFAYLVIIVYISIMKHLKAYIFDASLFSDGYAED